MKPILLSLTFVILALADTCGQELPLLKTGTDEHYIVTEDDEPFFWLGGTAWELLHRLDREEIQLYLDDRAGKGFTVIQTVILAEQDGLNTPNKYGHLPLTDNDPTKLNEEYFKLVDFTVEEAEKLGLYIALLPTWGDKFNKKWGKGPEIFTPDNAEEYGRLLAQRYQSSNNIIWVLGGDRIPESQIHTDIIRAMAKGILAEDKRHLLTYHPVGSQLASTYFNDEWMDIDMFQSGHSHMAKEYIYVSQSRKVDPPRPVINGEARYENIPDRFWENLDMGWLDDADVRVSAYWSMIAGAAGYTYGCNDIWQMYDISRSPVLMARTGWSEAIHLPGSAQMAYMRNIFEAFPWQQMKFDQSIILNDNRETSSYIVCALGQKEDFIIAYTPEGAAIELNLSVLKAQKAKAFWFNPRSGKTKKIGEFDITGPKEFKPWAHGWGSDFVLIVMDSGSTYQLPGLVE